MDHSKRITRTTQEARELSTDDIEEIIIKHLKLEYDTIDFDWNIGQWVSLTIRTKITETLDE